jgi:ABC-type sulfate/molybdate transport systems ATPase subunit
MRKRLALAAAALHDPALLLLDEPSNALDQEGRALFSRWMDRHRGSGGAAVIVTHRRSDIELCDRVLQLEDGRIGPISSQGSLLDEQGAVGS